MKSMDLVGSGQVLPDRIVHF